ncbi:hypothetical protein D047_3015B, partial [Vibrio parahaemolyticus VPTS-2010_2]
QSCRAKRPFSPKHEVGSRKWFTNYSSCNCLV